MKIAGFTAILFILITAGCRTATKLSSWKQEKEPVAAYNRILVQGFMTTPDNDIRENFEGRLSEYLQRAGINAVSSLELYGTRVFDKMDEDDALYQLNNSCVDAVLTVTLLNRKKELKYIPGTIYFTPYVYYYNRFWRYKTTINNRVHEPDYYDDASELFIECNLYDMKTQRLVYSVQTNPFSKAAYDLAAQQYGPLIVKNLMKDTVHKSPQ